MKKTALFAFVLLLLFSAPASAEFYRYTDETGAVRYTDDLSVVPKDQRPGMSTYSEPDDKLTDEERAAKEAHRQQAIKDQAAKLSEPAEQQQPSAPSAIDIKAEQEYQAAKAELDKMRQDLDAEYNALNADTKEVEDLKKSVKRPAAVRALNSRIQELNQRIAAYGDKRKTYDLKAQEVEQKKLSPGAAQQ